MPRLNGKVHFAGAVIDGEVYTSSTGVDLTVAMLLIYSTTATPCRASRIALDLSQSTAADRKRATSHGVGMGALRVTWMEATGGSNAHTSKMCQLRAIQYYARLSIPLLYGLFIDISRIVRYACCIMTLVQYIYICLYSAQCAVVIATTAVVRQKHRHTEWMRGELRNFGASMLRAIPKHSSALVPFIR